MEKLCTKCKQLLPIECFGLKKTGTDKRQYQCRDCFARYNRNRYLTNPAKTKEKFSAFSKAVRLANKTKLFEYLSCHPCVDCGEADPVVLEFDHLKDKVDSVSNLIRGGMPWHKIEAEIVKCEVRCSNCHKRKTAKLQNWLKLKLKI